MRCRPSGPTGDITLRVELRGYASVMQRVSLSPDEVGLLQIQLIPVMAAFSELLVGVDRGSETHGSSGREPADK